MTMFLITIVTLRLSLYSNPHPHPAEIDSGPPVPLAYFRPWLSPENTETQLQTSFSSHLIFRSSPLIHGKYLLHIFYPKQNVLLFWNLACLCGQVLLQRWQRILGRKRVEFKGGKLKENKTAQNTVSSVSFFLSI